ncbi:MAG TPA: hypothetical protein V6D23_24625, partial [Candidatus Obscuribacterales bacterium]
KQTSLILLSRTLDIIVDIRIHGSDAFDHYTSTHFGIRIRAAFSSAFLPLFAFLLMAATEIG